MLLKLARGWLFKLCDQVLNGFDFTSDWLSGWRIIGFHVTSPNSRIQNREAYKIFTFIEGKLPNNMSFSQFLCSMFYFLLKIEQFQFPSFHRA